MDRSIRKLIGALTASIVLHLLALRLSVRDLLPTPEPPGLPVEVSEIPTEIWNRGQVVDSDLAEEKLDSNTRFLGERNQHTDQPRLRKAGDGFGTPQASGSDQEAEPSSELLVGDPAEPRKRDWRKLSLSDLSVGGTGRLSDLVKDAIESDRTILSTREYLFHGFHQRIQRIISELWPPLLTEALAREWRRGKMTNPISLTTKLLVFLNENGVVQKISVVDSSGNLEIDRAARDAFQSAKEFPNPPRGLIDPNGLIAISYTFALELTDSAFQIQWRQPTLMDSPALLR